MITWVFTEGYTSLHLRGEHLCIGTSLYTSLKGSFNTTYLFFYFVLHHYDDELALREDFSKTFCHAKTSLNS